jgi:hypothetical protein
MKYTPDIFVGLDQAECSGWCIVAQGAVQAHGVTKDHQGIVAVFETVQRLCEGNLTRVLVVLEDHGGHLYNAGKSFQRNPKSLVTLGAARGWWEHEFGRAGHPESLCLRVTSADWRLRVLGARNSLGTERLKALAVQWAAGRALHPVSDDNEAEAIAIASWAALDGVARLEQRRTVGRIKARDKRGQAKQLGLPDMPAHKAVQRSSSGRF